MRKFNRKNFETREISIQKNFVENSDGSCLICFGKTMVICTAIIENEVPSWLKKKARDGLPRNMVCFLVQLRQEIEENQN